PFFFGGTKYNYADDSRGEVIIDSAGNIYVTTSTQSANFPITANAFQNTLAGNQDACVFKMNSTLTQLIWSTYLGGANDDAGYSIKIDDAGDVLVCGGTTSFDFPITPNAYNATYRGGFSDGFIVKLTPAGDSLITSTYIGTTAYDQVFFLDTDEDGFVYALGQTTGNFPIFSNVYNNPNSGQFIICLNATLDSLVFSTTFGRSDGDPDISPTAFLVDN